MLITKMVTLSPIFVVENPSPTSIGFENQSETIILTHPYMVASRGFDGD